MSNPLSPEQASELRHDLRTHLNQIGGYCGLLRDELPESAAVAMEPRLTAILRGSDELLEMLPRHLPPGSAVTAGHLAELRVAGEPVRAAIESACAALREAPVCAENADALADIGKIERAVARWVKRLADGC